MINVVFATLIGFALSGPVVGEDCAGIMDEILHTHNLKIEGVAVMDEDVMVTTLSDVVMDRTTIMGCQRVEVEKDDEKDD